MEPLLVRSVKLLLPSPGFLDDRCPNISAWQNLGLIWFCYIIAGKMGSGNTDKAGEVPDFSSQLRTTTTLVWTLCILKNLKTSKANIDILLTRIVVTN